MESDKLWDLTNNDRYTAEDNGVLVSGIPICLKWTADFSENSVLIAE